MAECPGDISIRRQLWWINTGMARYAHPLWFKGILLPRAPAHVRARWLIENCELGLVDLTTLANQGGRILLMSKPELNLLFRVATAMVLVDDLRLQVFGKAARDGFRVAGKDAMRMAAYLNTSHGTCLRYPELLCMAGEDAPIARRFVQLQRCLQLALCNGLHPNIGKRLRFRFRPGYFDSAERVAREKDIAKSLVELAPLIEFARRDGA